MMVRWEKRSWGGWFLRRSCIPVRFLTAILHCTTKIQAYITSKYFDWKPTLAACIYPQRLISIRGERCFSIAKPQYSLVYFVQCRCNWFDTPPPPAKKKMMFYALMAGDCIALHCIALYFLLGFWWRERCCVKIMHIKCT